MTSLTEENLFSIIIPVYNVEEFVADSLESVLEQDRDVLSKTEVLLIDDGSTDGSAAICHNYVSKYPTLFKYIHQENQGVSAARNHGISRAKGKYIGFLDSDDTYSQGVFRDVIDFFTENEHEIDVLAMPIYFFDASTGSHPLNFKFDAGSRVIDTRKEYDSILLHVTGAFFKAQAIKDSGLRFDVGRKYAEDKLFLTQLIQRREKYGVISSSWLNYRKRGNNSSAIQGSTLDPIWYRDTLWNIDTYLFWLFRNSKGKIPKYVQYVVAYDVQWRIKQEKQLAVPLAEQRRYVSVLDTLIEEIDVDVIMSLRNIYSEHKAYLLKKKFKEDPLATANYKDGVFTYRGFRIAKFAKGARLAAIHLAAIQDRQLTVEGMFFGLPFKGLTFGFVVGNEFQPAEIISDERVVISFLGDPVFERNVFSFTTNCDLGVKIRPAVKLPDGQIFAGSFITKDMCRIPSGISAYAVFGDYIVQNVRNQYLAIKKRTVTELVRRELSFWRRTVRSKTNAPKNGTVASVVLMRALGIFTKLLTGRNRIWILSDRQTSAGDNGASLYRYLVANPSKNTKFYYLLDKRSEAYSEFKRNGKVLQPGSVKAKCLFLASDLIISSQANDFVINEFDRDRNLFKDLYAFRFVFLQHGVILHDQSNWLNRFSKDISLFVTSARRERDSIINGNYGYSEKEVVLTGLARHDELYTSDRRKIVVAPTWRHGLVGDVDPETLAVPYNPNFKDSEFFHFYQALIEDPRLNEALRANDYDAELLLHPSFYGQSKDFSSTEKFVVNQPPNDYNKALSEARIMVTDYSSVAFDFAYLRKPIVYTHFDYEDFYRNHLWGEGYFDFETDGFGPITTKLDDLVEELIRLIESDGSMPAVYKERIDKFFAYNDRDNRSRIVSAIEELDRM